MLASRSLLPLVLVPLLSEVPLRCEGARPLSFRGTAFACHWRVDLFFDPAAFDPLTPIHAALTQALEDIDCQVSPYRPSSDLVRLNLAPVGARVALPALTCTLLRHALDMAVATKGAFDPSVLEVVEAWGFGARRVDPGLPPPTPVATRAPRQGWLDLDVHDGWAIKRGPARFDLCAIAKGYASDQLLTILRSVPGVTAALVDIGGELAAFGIKPDGQPWWVEIEAADTRLAVFDRAVATSGSRVRSFVHDGRRYSHTIDGAHMAPTQSSVVSATVVDGDGWRADALATALIVMDEEDGLQFADAHDVACLLLVDDNGTLRRVLSPALAIWQ